MAAAPIAGVIGSPISGALMGMHGTLGLKGWQWLFLVEGAPAILLGFVTMVFLPDKPEKATWLTEDERTWLVNAMQHEEARKTTAEHSKWKALIDWRVLVLALAYFGTSAGLYTVGIWAPLLIKNLGFSNLVVGFLVAVPNFVAVFGMLIWSWSSDRSGERYFHASIACLIAAAGMAIAAHGQSSTILALMGLSLTAFGVSAAKPRSGRFRQSFSPALARLHQSVSSIRLAPSGVRRALYDRLDCQIQYRL